MVASEQATSQARPRAAFPIVAAIAVFVVIAAAVDWPETLTAGLIDQANALARKPLGITWIIGLPALLIAERVFSVDRPDYREPTVIMSALYSLFLSPVMIVMVAFILSWSNDWVADNLNVFHVDVFGGWPAWAVGLAAFAISDFTLWVTHLIMHKVPVLWRIHEVHHSPTTMTMFVSDRAHPGEIVFRTVFGLGVIVVLGPTVRNLEWLAIVATFVSWWLFLVHANVRMSLGPLRYLFVTPQSHRIHHSAKPDHWDSNYGFVLSVWDWLFRTQHRDNVSYPPTGIGRERFPFPESRAPAEMASAFSAQMAWPFHRTPENEV